jgi:hypothetical protein
MPTSYTSLLGLALPVTGELSGTWGDTVNDYITQYLDAAVAGAQTISGSQTAVTLSKTTATSLSQAGSGSTGSSQYQIINCTGNPAGLLTITVPAASKAYLVLNSTSTSQSVKVVGAGPTTGVTMVSGERALIAWDGSDFVKVASSTADGVTTLSFGTTGLTPNSATAGAITVAGTLVAANGGTGQSSYTTGDLLYATGSTALSKLGIGTNGQVLTSTGTAPQWSTLSGVAVTTFSAGTTGFTPSTATSGAITLAGTLATTNGGTGLTSFTANGVLYASSTSALTTGSALTFDGSQFGVTTANNNPVQFSSSSTSNTLVQHTNANAAKDLIYRFRQNAGAGNWYDLTMEGATNAFTIDYNDTERFRIDSSGNLGLGVTPSAWNSSQWSVFEGAYGGALAFYKASNVPVTVLTSNAYNDGSWKYKTTDPALQYEMDGNVGIHKWYTAASGTAGNTISFTQAMTLDASGNLGVGATSITGVSGYQIIETRGSIGGIYQTSASGNSVRARFYSTSDGGFAGTPTNHPFAFITNDTERARITSGGNFGIGTASPLGKLDVAGTLGNVVVNANADQVQFTYNGFNYLTASGASATLQIQASGASGTLLFATAGSERARITAAGFTQPVAYADTVSALGNTGTATTINLLNANVFTATLTGNCTFTLSNPIATGSSSFTLILTNDGTAGRTVAWAGGSFVFPGGASALSRTTTANAVDVWVFFTPNGGTTWYGNIAMKDMKA